MSTRIVPGPAAPLAQRPLPPGQARSFAIDPVLNPRDSKALPILALLTLSFFVLTVYSRTIELIPGRGLVVGLGAGLLLYALVSGRLLKTRMKGSTFLLLAFTLWMVPAAVFGLWPGGSYGLVVGIWTRSLLVYFVIIALVHNVRTLRTMILMIALGDVAIAGMSFWLAADQYGRLVLDVNTLSNPNDLATFLLVGLPFCIYVVADSQRSAFLRVLMAVASVRIAWMVFRTGSRGALISALCVALLMMVYLKGGKRTALIVVALLGVLLAPFFLPAHIVSRYLTLVSDDVTVARGDRSIEFAQGSEESRLRVLLTSVEITLRNPVFGVGPGNFTVAYATHTKRDRRRGIWLQSHNAYTQVSSETGIPGAILFIGAIAYAFRTVNRIRLHVRTTAELRRYEAMGLSLLASMAAWAVCAAFSSIAYQVLLPLLLGLAIGMEHAFEDVARAAKVGRQPALRTAG